MILNDNATKTPSPITETRNIITSLIQNDEFMDTESYSFADQEVEDKSTVFLEASKWVEKLEIYLGSPVIFSSSSNMAHIVEKDEVGNYNTHFTPVYRIRRKRMEEMFPLSVNDK